MNAKQWDQLYHLLRTVSNSLDEEEAMAAAGLSAHIIGGDGKGFYEGLLTYLSYYGKTFLLEPTCKAVAQRKLKFSRIVEFGAGLGWLGQGMSQYFKVPYLPIDKRKWTPLTINADLEDEKDIKSVLGVLEPDDLIVMSDFLHCLGNPAVTMANFPGWNTVVLEYIPYTLTHLMSYKTQLERHGAKPFHGRGVMAEIFMFRGRTTYNLDPYILTLVGKLHGKKAKTKEAT